MFKVNHHHEEDDQKRNDTITWTIVKIMDVLDETEHKTHKEFRIDNHKDLKQLKNNFKLKIKFLGRSTEMLEIYYSFPKSIMVKSKLVLRLKAFTEHLLTEKEYREIKSNKWIYLATLFKNEIYKYLFSDGSLKFEFRFQVMTNIVTLENVPKGELSNDLHNLLDSGIFSDVIIKSSEGKEFNVHKAILAGRSTVLKAHFEHNTLECHTNIVESPLETDVLSEVLTFIYSDKSPLVDDIPDKLLAAAEFYQLDKLKKICEQALQEKLSVDNVVETLELAELYSANKLKEWSLQFIKDSHTKDITTTEGWANIKSVDLIKTIYKYITDDNDEIEKKTPLFKTIFPPNFKN